METHIMPPPPPPPPPPPQTETTLPISKISRTLSPPSLIPISNNMDNKALLLEDLHLSQKTENTNNESRKNGLSFRRWRLPAFLQEIPRRRSRCVVCLQVHKLEGLPSLMEDRVVIVGWKTKGWKGEQTMPVSARRGAASFDEVFLHYCNTGGGSTSKSITVWVSLVDAADCGLGTFNVDLDDLAMAVGDDSQLRGKLMKFDLQGDAYGGTLSLSVYCRVLDERVAGDAFDAHERRESRCFSCLPDLNCLRSRKLSLSCRKLPYVESDQGFITIENDSKAIAYSIDDEAKGFITMEEKGNILAGPRRRRPPSDETTNTDEDEEIVEGEKPCFLMDITEEFDVERVEDEFLRMLEDKCCRKAREGDQEQKRNGLKMRVDLDLESLIKEAESELVKAAQVRKSRAGAASLEKEEYEDLVMKSWGRGFGSPL